MSKAVAQKNPKSITIKGRLSYPSFTMEQALALNAKSEHKKPDEQVSPEFNLLIEADQMALIKDHLLNEYLPFAEQNWADNPDPKGNTRDAFPPKLAKRIRDVIENEDWETRPPYIFTKLISEKNLATAGAAVMTANLKGSKGRNTVLKASVYSDEELAIPGSIQKFPAMVDINESVFEMYPGAYVAATVNLFGYVASSVSFGISAGANVAVYMGNLEGERIGGGGDDVDEDEIFMD